MAENTRRFYNSQKTIEMGTAATNLSMGDCIPSQHITGDNYDKSLILQQLQCIPVGDCGAITGDTYQFSCRNFPAFTPLLGQQIKVRFTVANTYGDCQASPATFPKIRIGSLTLPIYAQGKSVGTGFNTANQVFNGCVMGTDISDPSTWWLDLDSNVRQTTSEYTIYSDGRIDYDYEVTTENMNMYVKGRIVTIYVHDVVINDNPYVDLYTIPAKFTPRTTIYGQGFNGEGKLFLLAALNFNILRIYKINDNITSGRGIVTYGI